VDAFAGRLDTRHWPPITVTICHCRFCQRATGSAYMVEPIFRLDDLRVTKGSATVFRLHSAGSGKQVGVHFCSACGTKLYLSFERFPATCGVYAVRFDDPNLFLIGSENARHIFTEVARHDTVLPAGIATFREHAIRNDGTSQEPVVFDHPHSIRRTWKNCDTWREVAAQNFRGSGLSPPAPPPRD
jgi:hypothetical protein